MTDAMYQVFCNGQLKGAKIDTISASFNFLFLTRIIFEGETGGKHSKRPPTEIDGLTVGVGNRT